MAQNSNILRSQDARTRYTRVDFMALRMWSLKLPSERISALYPEDCPQLAGGIDAHMRAMRMDLIDRAVANNPRLFDVLAKARQGGAMSTQAVQMLVQAAEAKPRQPEEGDDLRLWLRPEAARMLAEGGIVTLRDLVERIKEKGSRWWLPIPRFGCKRARVIEHWLESHGHGDARMWADRRQLAVPRALTLEHELLPLDCVHQVVPALDGSHGLHRAPLRPLINASNDLQAIHIYLDRFTDHTVRAYRRELERLLLWAIVVKRVPLSSLQADDVEQYKAFLAAPSVDFVGPKVARTRSDWKPFEGPLSPASQRFAVRILRSAFDWLVKVAYLRVNVWNAVQDPRVVKQVGISTTTSKFLEQELALKVMQVLAFATQDNDVQRRLERAAFAFLISSGARVASAAAAKRADLRPSRDSSLWYLSMLDKGAKERLVVVPTPVVEILKAHWMDTPGRVGLLCPVGRPGLSADHFTAGGLANMVKAVFVRLSKRADFTVAESLQLASMSAHGLRHTMGTHMVNGVHAVGVDIVRLLLGHASISTTSKYVHAEEDRMLAQVANYWGRSHVFTPLA